MPIRAMIVDDEPTARASVRQLLRADPEIHLVGEAGDGREAVHRIEELHPDLVFLDVQMPEMTGFEVLAQLEYLPAVVLVTAFDQYALRAFDIHAVDYLLKPYSDERFRASVVQAKAWLQQGHLRELQRRLKRLLEDFGVAPGAAAGEPGGGVYPDRLMVKSGGQMVLVRVADIDWIDAERDHMRIHVGQESHLLRESMKGLEAKLDPAHFIRIHRSTIVNLDRVTAVRPFYRGEYVAVLQSGTTLKISRGYRAHLERRLGDRI